MNTPSRPKRKKTFAEFLIQPSQLVNIVRASIYMIFGSYLLFVPFILADYPLYKYLFCGFSVLYGVFRWYRIYADYKAEENL